MVTSKVIKRALIRDSETPVGQPGKMHLLCGCGERVEMADDDIDTTCPTCGQTYDSRGYLVAARHD